MSPKLLLGLIACNLLWSLNPVMGKLVLVDFGPAHAAWLRYASGFAVYLLALPWLNRGSRAQGHGPAFARPTSASGWLLVGALGLTVFGLSPLLQMSGLHASRAVDGAMIVAMEPIMAVVIARLFLGERTGREVIACFALAIVGFCLLAGLTPTALGQGVTVADRAHMIGNLLLLTALIGEASSSTFARKLMDRRHQPLGIFGTSLGLGVLLLTIAVGLPPIMQFSWSSALGVLYLGACGTTVTYLYWSFALVQAPVSAMALTLFVQPVFGTAWGALFLGERLDLTQGLGAALILVAVLGQSLIGVMRRAK